MYESVLVAQSSLTLCNPTDYSLPGSSVHGILQARILEWVPFSRGSSQPRDQTQVPHIAGRFATREALDMQRQGSNFEGQFPKAEPGPNGRLSKPARWS